MAGDSTVRREYLRALILSVSGTENLLPSSQVVAERVIATIADSSCCIAGPPPAATSPLTCSRAARHIASAMV